MSECQTQIPYAVWILFSTASSRLRKRIGKLQIGPWSGKMASLDQILTKRRCIIIAEKLIEVLSKSSRVEISLVHCTGAILLTECILINQWGSYSCCFCEVLRKALQPGLDVLFSKPREETREANHTLAIDQEHAGQPGHTVEVFDFLCDAVRPPQRDEI